MNGYYRINKQRCKQKLKFWLTNLIQEQGWIHYDDLHVDEVSDVFQPRNRWFYGGLFLLDSLWQMLEQSTYDCFLAIPLLEANGRTDVNEINLDYIKNSLHEMTPPSLYVFPRDCVKYNEWFEEWRLLGELSSSKKWSIYFFEYYEDDGIFVRSIFFQPK